MNRVHIQMMIPEMRKAGYIDSSLSRKWRQEMAKNNQVIRRGNKMSLLPHRVSEFADLDLYMLRVRGGYLTEVLNCVCDFGERVVRQRQKRPSERVWRVTGHISIEQARWEQLCTCVMNVVCALGYEEATISNSCSHHLSLETAARRAKRIFGKFSCADPHIRPITEQGSNQIADADGQDSICGKRRRVAPSVSMSEFAFQAKLEMAEAASSV